MDMHGLSGGPNPAAHKDVHAPKCFLMCAEKQNKVCCIQKIKMIQDAFLQTEAVGSGFEPKVTYIKYAFNTYICQTKRDVKIPKPHKKMMIQ